MTLGTLSAPLAGEAQPVGQSARIGWLGFASSASPTALEALNAFRQGLRELGWSEGQNLVIEHRWAEGRAERYPDLAA